MGVPSGLVTLLFTDIEGSTRLWEEYPVGMAAALSRHDELLRSVIEGHNGYVFKTVGDAFCAAFSDAADALITAVDAQRALTHQEWPEDIPVKVRMALHSGRCHERDGDFFGPTVNRAARLEAVAHGGQIVCSSATAELARQGIAGTLQLIDLGEHRLKDLGLPERVLQVTDDSLQGEFPPLRSLTNPLLANNLPAQVTHFVGRDKEVAEVHELLQRSRLVSLTGTGGVGKTRLALQVAADLVDGSGGGVWLVELALITDQELVVSAVASALDVKEQPGRPLLDTLIDRIGDSAVLILMDNCEHVIDSVAMTVDALLRRCPGVVFLCTTREPLAIQGEMVYRVPSLSVPASNQTGPDEIVGYEAVQLFLDRSSAHQPSFALHKGNAAAVASICRRLDGVPLAIELAVARLRSMSPPEIETRLDERFRLLTGGSRVALPRHRTLRALIDWSYDLLRTDEQSVLRKLSVFAGTWSTDAVGAVVESLAGNPLSIMDVLSSLIDKSLINRDDDAGQDRYYLLESVRQYCDERLRAAGEDHAQHAHATFYLGWAETNAPHLEGQHQGPWTHRFDVEYPNLAGAIRYLTENEPRDALRMAVALSPYWILRGQWTEGARVLSAALERTRNLESTLSRVAALTALLDLKMWQGEYKEMVHLGHEALRSARDLGSASMVVECLTRLSAAYRRLGDPETSLSMAAEAVEAARALSDPRLLALTLRNLGGSHDALGNLPSARTAAQEAVELYRRMDDRRGVLITLSNLGYYEQSEGNVSAARGHVAAVLDEAIAIGDVSLIANATLNLGFLDLEDGDWAGARERFQSVRAQSVRTNARMDVAYAVLGLALCASAAGADEPAAKLHGLAARHFEELGVSPDRYEASLREADRARLERTMGPAALAAAHASGEVMADAQVEVLVTRSLASTAIQPQTK